MRSLARFILEFSSHDVVLIDPAAASAASQPTSKIPSHQCWYEVLIEQIIKAHRVIEPHRFTLVKRLAVEATHDPTLHLS